MDFDSEVLGTNTVKALTERLNGTVLAIGRDRLTRDDLATVHCFNFIAARNLSAALTDLGVKSTRDLFDTIAPSALAVPGIGSVAVAVLGAAFQKYGLGGGHPLKTWMTKHQDNPDIKKAVATFVTVKHRANADRREEKRAKKLRKQARRNQAHKLRTERFTERAERAAAST